MNWEFEIILSPRAVKNLKALDHSNQKRVKNAIHKLAQFPPKCDVIKLHGGKGSELRLRVGNWRVTFEYDFKEKQVHVLTIKNRREAYRK